MSNLTMVDVIRQAVMPQDRKCPFCGDFPGLSTQRAGRYLVGCESEDCAANPQVGGTTLAEAWKKWNGRQA